MSESKYLSKLKKPELQSLADSISLPGGSDGLLRSDLEDKLAEYISEKGGPQTVVDKGLLKDKKLISALGLSPAKPGSSKSVSDKVVSAKKTAVAAVKPALSKAASSWSGLSELLEAHSPENYFNFAKNSGVYSYLTELREKLATPESLVLVLVYLELAAFLLSQVAWSSSPVATFVLPQWLEVIFAGPLRHMFSVIGGHLAVQVYRPDLSHFLQAKVFFYPFFYWAVYFVIIPSILGWLVNFEAVHSKAEHICPVNMLTFSVSRLLAFFLVLKSDVTALFSQSIKLETSHRSLTVLFDGHHLPTKLFLMTGIVGVIYSIYGRKR